MDVLRAAYLVAHDFEPSGAVGLAKKMGVPVGTFLNELNPEQETHKLGLGRAVAMSVAAGDVRILHAFADTCGCVAFPKPNLSNVSDEALLDLFLARDEAIGRFAEVVRRALSDGSVSAAELEEIKETAYHSAASLLEIVARLKGLRDG
ncbi:MAG: phage regulatory CII family protein [Dechloromonas sp.]|nr:phage regulatory CII family protein [Dechloromonas sp.]